MKKGKNLMLKLGTTIYGYASDCSFNISTDTTEVSHCFYWSKIQNLKQITTQLQSYNQY